jgi:hypothetical protein
MDEIKTFEINSLPYNMESSFVLQTSDFENSSPGRQTY